MIKHPKAIGPLAFNATIGRLCGPAGGVAFPFDIVKKTLWSEGRACPYVKWLGWQEFRSQQL